MESASSRKPNFSSASSGEWPKTHQHAPLQCGIEDAERSTADLVAVDDEVVAVREHLEWCRLDHLDVLLEWLRERVVARGVALVFFVPLEHREVDDPKRVEARSLDPEFVGHLEPKHSEDLVRDVASVGDHEHEVAGLDLERRAQRRHLGFGEELGDRRADVALRRERDPGEPLGASVDGGLIERVDAAAREVARTLRVDALDDAALRPALPRRP